MPDFLDAMVEPTVKFLTERGFRVEVEGVGDPFHGAISKQNPRAGSPLVPGQIIHFTR